MPGTALHGPASPFMECDYTPKDESVRHILPGRMKPCGQTVGRMGAVVQSCCSPSVKSNPVPVNTSLTVLGPMVQPRDAVRVFFGPGIDTLVLGEFVIRK